MTEYQGLPAEFRERYQIVMNAAMLRAERAVIGGDYGASSFTTMAQADDLARCLNLGPGRLLLDLGSGSGWPGNYLARKTGCTVVLTDPTIEGMTVASARIADDRLDGWAVVANGESLPFGENTFDAVTSSDVFCCLDEKLSVMRETQSVLKSGALACFYTITTRPGLAPAESERLQQRDGYEHAESEIPYDEMMEMAGFTHIELTDVTAAYLNTLQEWRRSWEVDEGGLRDLLGDAEFERRVGNRRLDIDNVEAGILRRYRALGVKP